MRMERGIIRPQICQDNDLSQDIREALFSAHDHTCIRDDRIYMMIGQTVFCLANDEAGKALRYAVTNRQNSIPSRPTNAEEVYQRILNDPDYQPDPALVRKTGISQDQTRCITVFRALIPMEKDLYSYIHTMAPIENGDKVISVDYQTAVLIRNTEGQTGEEIKEFIEAVIGTMEAEGIVDIRAGIGREYKDISGIRTGYQEGMQALQLGMRYHRQEHVFVFEKQTLERIVDTIPDEKKAMLLETFFGTGSGNVLSDEMMETVSVFFRNDLNLTAASKQLFIHRNTLNYRLDKIKKDFGLDLRTYQDAVVFRIITEIANRS